MTFEEDLTKRRIDVAAFAAGDPEKFAAWQSLYQQVHPNSFYASLKMVMNDVRRRFWLQEAPKPATAPATAPKPVVRRATATVPSTASAIPDEPSPSVDRTPEPAPAPKGRAVIRRPAADATVTPADKTELSEENTISLATEATPAGPPKPARARPVFRRPAGEPTADAPAGKLAESKNKPAETSETGNSAAETPKLPKPRPVFRKPTMSTESSTAADVTAEAPTATNTTDLPEHSNPNPEETAKPSRQRPVFKRPSLAAPELAPENTLAESKSEKEPETNLAAPATQGSVSPRPRPVIKRPATPVPQILPNELAEGSIPPDSAPEQVSVISGNVVPEPVITLPAASEQEIPVPDATVEAPALKPLRPRPVFKRPAKPEPPEGARGNESDKA